MDRLGKILAGLLLIYRTGFCGAPEFAPMIANKDSPPGKAPESMVWVPGGEFMMGAAMNGGGSCEMPMASNDAGPSHPVRVDGFWMDQTTVTNE
jgi:sulfatase modifying factor 1